MSQTACHTLGESVFLVENDVKKYERALFIDIKLFGTTVTAFNDILTGNFVQKVVQNTPAPTVATFSSSSFVQEVTQNAPAALVVTSSSVSFAQEVSPNPPPTPPVS